MNRRRLLQIATVLAAGKWIGEVKAQSTPIAVPTTPAMQLSPAYYGDISEQYGNLASQLLELGRTVIDELVDGDTNAIYGRLAPPMQAIVSKSDLSQLFDPFTTNQAHFEAPSADLVFDAQLVEDDILTGFVQQDVAYPFHVRRIFESGQGSPVAGPFTDGGELSGTWQGTIDLLDGQPIQPSIELKIALSGRHGSVSIPDWDVASASLAAIVFRAEQSLGKRVFDRAIPHSHDMGIYWTRYEWGGRGMIVRLVFDGMGTIMGALVSPEWQLPPDPASGLPPLPLMHLPFEGLWWVYWGGDTVPENYHATVPSQRHALDLMIWNGGATYHDDPGVNANYWVWGQPVLAPADGIVVAVVDGIEANIPGQFPVESVNGAGNHVVLQIGEDAYLLLAHMQAASIPVSIGDFVIAGTRVGLVGNTGRSSEPHLHIHAQSDPDSASLNAIGLPLTFENVLVDTEFVSAGTLQQGELVVQR